MFDPQFCTNGQWWKSNSCCFLQIKTRNLLKCHKNLCHSYRFFHKILLNMYHPISPKKQFCQWVNAWIQHPSFWEIKNVNTSNSNAPSSNIRVTARDEIPKPVMKYSINMQQPIILPKCPLLSIFYMANSHMRLENGGLVAFVSA